MDCRQAEYYITQRLDQLLSEEENAALEQHLASCKACAGELALQERLSRTLREMGGEEIQAPAALSSLVMNNIRPQRHSALAWLPVTWRKAVAAAATLLLLAGGSAGVMNGLNLAGNGKTIVMETTPPNTSEVQKPGGAGEIPGNNANNDNTVNPAGNTADVSPALAPLESGAGDKPGGNQAGSPPVAAQNLQQAGNPNNAENGLPTVKPAGDKAGAATGNARVLLSNDMKVTSTVLKVSVDDLTTARTRAASLAAEAGAAIQVFPEQTSGKTVLVMRLTVDSDQAPYLTEALSGLGTSFHRQDEKRDLLPLYNETTVQYNELLERRDSATDSGERRQLDVQAASYKQLLDAWEAEAGKQVINLWLENK
ncbi:MAG: hypothetical protein BWY80_00094 [Firmicutes bacterium ADurb.Bin456]|nr:MAG: hypothetical protein BWY80_00094 [Firmicutes bacterium ADurb.Bin456]